MDQLSGVSVFSAWLWLDSRGLIIFTLVFLVTVEYLRNRRPSNFPPGPTAFPLVGNMFSLDFNNAYSELTKLTETYGNVYSLKMGRSWTVVLNGLNTLQEGLLTKGDILADRPIFPIHVDVLPELGIIFTNGHMWKQQRRFALFTLKYFGVGKKSLEFSILDEFIYLSKEIANHKGKPFNPHFIINKAVSNIICSLIFGHRYEYSDEKFLKMMNLIDRGTQIEGSIWAQLYNAFPMLMRRLPGPHHTLQKTYCEIIKLMKTEVDQHKEDWDPSEPRDYIDCYLSEIQRMKKDDEVDAGFHEDNLVMCSFDLFGAGTETTSTTLRWAFLYMAKYTEIQEKVQAEINRVIGQSRQPSMEDRANLPYTDAVIHEIQRMGNIVPLSLPHIVSRDVQLGGYTIPKGVTIIPNLTSVLFDKDQWETPYSFNPGHFLNEEGKFVKRAAFIPFSAGKRICLGENLARMELFLFFTSLMQRFTFSMPSGVEPVLEPRISVILSPREYEICATLREV
ncbi:cytochrome P450 2J2-like [Seriola lalandi dorsalis]|uniref:cytochrome P450 2J2-like n=1 Tax=Seriola lalandi dorsalis TaxID=1841481 RepID=UPI000C6F6FAB|nr:cytochrome P450 2J2-like [Seriola lalandi dorsalis]